MSEIQIVHAYGDNPKITMVPSSYCKSGMVYLLSPKDDFIIFARNLYQAEKEKAEWIRKYEKVLRGLEYWRDKAGFMAVKYQDK